MGKASKALFSTPPQFVAGALKEQDIPYSDVTEVAFAGRSNVGKSSLLNAVFGRRDVARASNTPGRTQQLNFFLTANKKLMVVDLPGYGYAKTSRKQVRRWEGLTRDYLVGRKPLKRVFLLIDSRHGIKKSDEEMMEMLDETAVSYQIVLTKVDKLKASEIDKVCKTAKDQVGKRAAAHPEVLVSSAEKAIGIEGIRGTLAALVS